MGKVLGFFVLFYIIIWRCAEGPGRNNRWEGKWAAPAAASHQKPSEGCGQWRGHCCHNCLAENQPEAGFTQNYSSLRQLYKTQVQMPVKSSITVQPTQAQGCQIPEDCLLVWQDILVLKECSLMASLRRRVFDSRSAAPRKTSSMGLFRGLHLHPNWFIPSLSCGDLL